MAEDGKKQSNFFNKRILKIVIMLCIMIGFGLLPPPGAITPLGMKVLGVFLGMLFGWIFIEVGSTSIIGIACLVLTGCVSMTDALAGTFGTQTAILFLMVFLFTAYIEEENLGEIVAFWILKRKFLDGKPYLTFFFFLLASYLVGILSGSLVAVFLMVALLRSINEIVKFQAYSKQLTVFVIGISFTSVLGELGLPTKGVAVVYMSLYASQTGQVFNTLKYLLAVIPISIFIIFCFTILCKFILRIDMSRLAGSQECLPIGKRITAKQKIALYATAIYMVCLIIPSISLDNPLFQKIALFGSGGIALVMFGIMMMIQINQEPIIDVRKIAHRFPWDFFIMCITIVYIAGFLTTDATGIKVFLTDSLYPFVSHLGAFALVVCLFLITAVLTNFINNIVAGSLMISLGIALSNILPDLNLSLLTIMLALAGMLAVATPVASPNSAWIFAQKDLVKPNDMVLYGFITVIFLSLCVALVGYWYVVLIF